MSEKIFCLDHLQAYINWETLIKTTNKAIENSAKNRRLQLRINTQPDSITFILKNAKLDENMNTISC